MKQKTAFTKNYNLLLEMIRTDFKLRYQGSALGYMWSFMKPLALFGILYIVFSKFLRIGADVPNYALSLLLGVVLWTFFIEAVARSLKSIVSGGQLIRKVSIPVYLLPLATIFSAGINLVLNLAVILIFIIIKDPSTINPWALVVGPAMLLQLFAIAAAFGYFLAAAYVRFRDVEHVWEITKQGFFYTIPIIYPLSIIPSETIQKILLLNPIATTIQAFRVVLTYEETLTIASLYGNSLYYLVPALLTIVSLIVGLLYFNSKAKSFAEGV